MFIILRDDQIFQRSCHKHYNVMIVEVYTIYTLIIEKKKEKLISFTSFKVNC
jgi:hypothetical protein